MNVTRSSTLLCFPCLIHPQLCSKSLTSEQKHRKRKGGKKRGGKPFCAVGRVSEDLSSYFPIHWKMCEHLCGMRCICSLLQPLAFPFPWPATHGTNRHFWQLSAMGPHLCTAFQEQSTEPAITSATALARDTSVLVVLDCSTTRSSSKPNESFLISVLPSHVDFEARPSPTAAVLPRNRQQKWPKIFAVNLLTKFTASSCHMFLESI